MWNDAQEVKRRQALTWWLTDIGLTIENPAMLKAYNKVTSGEALLKTIYQKYAALRSAVGTQQRTSGNTHLDVDTY